jgi:hypothetical protein
MHTSYRSRIYKKILRDLQILIVWICAPLTTFIVVDTPPVNSHWQVAAVLAGNGAGFAASAGTGIEVEG